MQCRRSSRDRKVIGSKSGVVNAEIMRAQIEAKDESKFIFFKILILHFSGNQSFNPIWANY